MLGYTLSLLVYVSFAFVQEILDSLGNAVIFLFSLFGSNSTNLQAYMIDDNSSRAQ